MAKQRRKTFFSIQSKLIVLAFLAAALSVSGVVATFSLNRNSFDETANQDEMERLERINYEMDRELEHYRNDAQVLAQLYETRYIATHKDFISDDPEEMAQMQQGYQDELEHVQDFFVNFSGHHPWHTQLRYIDENGQEIVRVQKKSAVNESIVIPESELQNKADRYYFQEAIGLARDEVYISDLDLNVEYGEIVEPYEPTIRIATPVFDESGQNRGIIVINTSGYLILDLVEESGLSGPVYLVDQDGYFLFNSEASDREWSRYLGTNYRFEEMIEDSTYIRDQLRINSYLSYTSHESVHRDHYYKIEYDTIDESKYWVVINTVAIKDQLHDYFALRNDLIGYSILTLSIVLLLFIAAVLNLVKPMKYLRQAINQLEQGNYNYQISDLSNDEFGQIASWMNSLITQYRESEKEKALFITSASHQLRTPISGIGFQLDMIVDELKQKRGAKKIIAELEEVVKNNHRAAIIMEDLFKLIEIGDRYYASNKKNRNVLKILNSILDSFDVQIKAQKLNLKVEVNAKLMAWTESSALKLILNHLIENAIKYSNPGGTITVEAVSIEDTMRFQIHDNGIGIPAKDQVHIFERFFRAKNAYLKESVGSGLGLAIVKLLVEGHGGEVGFSSKEGEGTTFWFTLPNSEQ